MGEASAASTGATGPVVFYDGECPFCLRSVSFLLEHDPHARLRFAPLQGALASRVLSDAERTLGPESSVVLYESDRRPTTALRSEAMARALASTTSRPQARTAVARSKTTATTRTSATAPGRASRAWSR